MSGVPSAVLPSFEVTLEPEEKFLYIDRKENFRVSITAKCVWGGGDTPNGVVTSGGREEDGR